MEKALLSSLVKNHVPGFVRDEYPTFILFLEKYYEWLETTQQVSEELYNLKNSFDIDASNNFYLEQLRQDLLPYFPSEIMADKRLFLKLIGAFYRSNGTQNSIKFLFRALYNENIDIYYPKDDILIASDGKWVLPLALRIDTNDSNILNIEKTLLTGLTSKATALVEKVIRSVDRQLGITYIEVYVSNVSRQFTTGEIVNAVYNNGTEDISVSGRLVGALSEISIDPRNRGLLYNGYDETTGYSGDPVTIVGGLNPLAASPIGAIAHVGQTTRGSITDIAITNGGFGFRNQEDDPNTIILDFVGGFDGSTFGTEAKAELSLVDENSGRTINVATTSVSTLNSAHINIAAIESNTISSITGFDSFNVYSMSFVSLSGSGGGYRTKPTLETYSLYNEFFDDSLVISSANIVKGTRIITDNTQNLTNSFEAGDYVRLFLNNRYEEVLVVDSVTTNTLSFVNVFPNDISGVSVFKLNRNDLYKLGSIGRILVTSGGNGYQLNDIITFTGGSGYGANAYVSEVFAGNNGIKTVTINNHSSGAYVIGGEGYTRDSLPTLSVQSANGANAILYVSEVAGDGESLDLTTSRIGSISSLRITSYGYDYVEAPKISLRNADLVVSNITEGQLFVSNTSVYQGASNISTTFKATVDSYNPSTGILRVFDYRGTVDTNIRINSDDGTVNANVISSSFYGDGRAKATADFENGLIRYPGLYLNTDGQVSSDKRLQDGDKYHNFSYIIKSKTDYAKFKNPLYDISHPVGTKIFVTRVDDNDENVTYTPNSQTLLITALGDSYNISRNSNIVASTNTSSNLRSTVNVGDYIIINSINRPIQNTLNVVSGSNVIFGTANNVNFINDLLEGDVLSLSTGNTVTITEVSNSTHAKVDVIIGVTSSSVTANVVYTETRRVSAVAANTITVTSNYRHNGSFLTANVQKHR
jgi:hypothetical protein